MERIKRFINEWTMILVVYGCLVGLIGFQLWYTLKLKSELKLFQEQEHIVIQKVVIGKDTISKDTLRINHNKINHKME
jgi:hypothetical protein